MSDPHDTLVVHHDEGKNHVEESEHWPHRNDRRGSTAHRAEASPAEVQQPQGRSTGQGNCPEEGVAVKGPGRYSRKGRYSSNLEARTASYEDSVSTCKTKQAGGFHKPGSNKK